MTGGDEKVGVDALVGRLAKAVVANQRHSDDIVLAEALRDALDARRGAPAPLPPLNFHRVAPKGVSCLGLGHPNFIAVGHPHEAGAHAGNLDGALGAGLLLKFRGRQDVAAAAEVFELALLGQFLHQGHHRPTDVVVQNAERARHLLVVEGLAGALPKHAQHRLAKVRGRSVIRRAVHPALAFATALGASPHKLVAARPATSFPAHASKMRLVAELAAP